MGAAVETPTRFHSVAYDPALAVRTSRRERGNRAFKAVEIMGDSVLDDLEAFVVLVAAYLALAPAVFVGCGFSRARSAWLFLRLFNWHGKTSDGPQSQAIRDTAE